MRLHHGKAKIVVLRPPAVAAFLVKAVVGSGVEVRSGNIGGGYQGKAKIVVVRPLVVAAFLVQAVVGSRLGVPSGFEVEGFWFVLIEVRSCRWRQQRC